MAGGYNILSVDGHPVGGPYLLETGVLGGFNGGNEPPLEELLR